MRKTTRLVRGISVLSCAALVLSGCATAGKVKLQTVRVSVADEKCADVGAARCTLRNGAGDWQLNAPGVATVSVDAEPLRISCTSEDGKQAGDASLERKSTTGRNMLIGAGAGLLVGGVAGASQSRKDSKNGDLLAGFGLAVGVLWGVIVGTGAGAASGETGYADAVRVTLRPLPKPATP
ncbi:hypothetical protein [Roseateles sp.]|uniref:hypothetical protein n=1 Tax=Roseateles sp. TaxID=1971397 RepID=UPI003264BB26